MFWSAVASAECGAVQVPQMQQQSWHESGYRLMPVSFGNDDRDQDPIAGFWNILLTAKGNVGGPPDGTVIDKGLQQWHADGTEFLSSSAQNPQTGNYCIGVWEKTSDSTYALNHFAYLYDLTGKSIGLVNIREEVKLSHDHSTIAGTFEIQAYDPLRNKIGGLLTGKVVGHRITIHSKPSEIL